MPAGRPTSYSQEMLDKTLDYLEECKDGFITKWRDRILEDKETGEKEVVEDAEPYTVYKVKIPTIEGLAVYLGVRRETIYNWEKEEENVEFSNVIARLRQMQADALINKGLDGTYNPTIAKVLLTKHGYREGTDITTSDKPFVGLSDEDKQQLDAIAGKGNAALAFQETLKKTLDEGDKP